MESKKALSWLDNYVLGLATGNPSPLILASLQKMYPNVEEFVESTVDGCLYRGFFFEEIGEAIAFVEQLIKTKSIVSERISSWTEDIWKAYDFLNGAGYEYYSGEKASGYGIILSCADIDKEQVVVSYLNLPEISQQGQENMRNDSEFILLPGEYEVEIRKLTANMKSILSEDILTHITEETFIEEE